MVDRHDTTRQLRWQLKRKTRHLTPHLLRLSLRIGITLVSLSLSDQQVLSLSQYSSLCFRKILLYVVMMYSLLQLVHSKQDPAGRILRPRQHHKTTSLVAARWGATAVAWRRAATVAAAATVATAAAVLAVVVTARGARTRVSARAVAVASAAASVVVVTTVATSSVAVAAAAVVVVAAATLLKATSSRLFVSAAGVELSWVVWTALLGELHAQVAALEILALHGFDRVFSVALLHETHERKATRLVRAARARDVHIADFTEPGSADNQSQS